MNTIAEATAMTYQDAMFRFTWSAVEFCANIAVILYVAAFFGIIRPPKQPDNVTETVTNQTSGLGSFFKEAAGVAKSINTAISTQLPQAIPVTTPTPDKK